MSQGESTFVKSIFKFGDKLSSVTSYNVLSNMGVVAPAYLTTPQIITLSSEGSTDTASGTGARAVVIEGVGSGWIEQSETVWLAGTSAASTALEWCNVDRMYVTRCGSNDRNAGQIWAGYGALSTGVPANKLSMIMSLSGQTEKLHFTIPVSLEAHIQMFEFHSGKASGADAISTFQIQVRDLSDTDRPWRNKFTASTLDGDVGITLSLDSFVIAGPAQVRVMGRSSVAGALQSGMVSYDLHKIL